MLAAVALGRRGVREQPAGHALGHRRRCPRTRRGRALRARPRHPRPGDPGQRHPRAPHRLRPRRPGGQRQLQGDHPRRASSSCRCRSSTTTATWRSTTPPTSITAEVDRLDSRSVPVTVDYSQHPPPQGYVVVNRRDHAQRRSRSSARSTSSPASRPRSRVDLANQKTNFQADETVLLYNSRTGSGWATSGSASPSAATRRRRVLVTIEVAASLTSRASAVLPKVSGSVGAGPLPRRPRRVSPATVVLNGPQDLLNTLELGAHRDDLAQRHHRHAAASPSTWCRRRASPPTRAGSR